jgi:hypothetical protein
MKFIMEFCNYSEMKLIFHIEINNWLSWWHSTYFLMSSHIENDEIVCFIFHSVKSHRQYEILYLKQ